MTTCIGPFCYCPNCCKDGGCMRLRDEQNAAGQANFATLDSQESVAESSGEPASAAPIQAHSMSEYRRITAQGGNVVPPAAHTPRTEAERIALWLEDAANDGFTSASIGDQHNFRVAAKKIRQLERELAEKEAALAAARPSEQAVFHAEMTVKIAEAHKPVGHSALICARELLRLDALAGKGEG